MSIRLVGSEIFDEYTQELANGNRFSADDLRMNRKRKISNRQMLRLSLQAMRPFYSALATFLGWLLFVHVVKTFIPGFILAFIPRQLTGGTVTLIGCAWGLAAGFAESTRTGILLLFDLLRGEAYCLEGQLSTNWIEEDGQGLDRIRGEKKNLYFYTIRQAEFEVGEQAYHAVRSLNRRLRAKLYHTPRSRLLLSIEVT